MLRSLQIFCDLATTKSFTDTAHRNYLTQSAVSRHIKTLEDKYGHRLFDRRQMRLTRSGRLMYETGQEVLYRMEQLEHELSAPTKPLTGPLRINAVETVGIYELPRYLKNFLKQNPKVDIQLNYRKNQEVYDAVLSKQVELGFVDYPKTNAKLDMVVLFRNTLVVVVPPEHPFARLKSRRIRPSRLEGQPFVTAQSGMPRRQALDCMLRKHSVRVRYAYAFDNVEMLKRAVEVGLGIALIPPAIIQLEAEQGSLVPIHLGVEGFERAVGVITLKEAVLSLAAERFLKLVGGRKE